MLLLYKSLLYPLLFYSNPSFYSQLTSDVLLKKINYNGELILHNKPMLYEIKGKIENSFLNKDCISINEQEITSIQTNLYYDNNYYEENFVGILNKEIMKSSNKRVTLFCNEEIDWLKESNILLDMKYTIQQNNKYISFQDLPFSLENDLYVLNK